MERKKRSKKEEKVSTNISNFLNFIDTCKQEYDYCKTDLEYKEKQTQDILHAIELYNLKYKERAKLSTKLQAIRKERRKSKLKVQLLDEFIKFINIKENININKLRFVLGEMRKEEKREENSKYTPRTDILKEIE